MSQAASQKILARIYGGGRGAIFTPKDFHDLASDEAVRATLSRLTRAGTIRRLARGVYDYPERSRLLDAPAPPDPDGIARAVARAHGWTILPEGDTALNLLGLSTQVPAHWRYFSDGPTRTLAWAGGDIGFRHRTNQETTALSPRVALLVQALRTLGRERVDDDTLARLKREFDARELARAVREARYATAWVYEIVKRLAAEKGTADA